MDVRRFMSRFGSLSVILVLSLVVLAACGRDEDAKPTPTGEGVTGIIDAASGTVESAATVASGLEGTVASTAISTSAEVGTPVSSAEGSVEAEVAAVEGSVEAAATEVTGAAGVVEASVEADATEVTGAVEAGDGTVEAEASPVSDSVEGTIADAVGSVESVINPEATEAPIETIVPTEAPAQTAIPTEEASPIVAIEEASSPLAAASGSPVTEASPVTEETPSTSALVGVRRLRCRHAGRKVHLWPVRALQRQLRREPRLPDSSVSQALQVRKHRRPAHRSA